MRPQDLQRTAHTVECFLNALRLEDGPARTELEETLLLWLVDAARLDEDHLIYEPCAISCFTRGHITAYYEVPLAQLEKTLWCSAKKLSEIDGPAFSQHAQLIMRGADGLVLSLPGTFRKTIKT